MCCSMRRRLKAGLLLAALAGAGLMGPIPAGADPLSARIKAAAKTQDSEDRLTAAETRLAAVTAEETAVQAEIATETSHLGGVLSAAERLALEPPGAMLAAPESPDDSVRSAILMKAAVPGLQSRIAELRQHLHALQDLRQQVSLSRDQAAAARHTLDLDRQALAAVPVPPVAVDPLAQAIAAARADRAASEAASPSDLVATMANAALEDRATRFRPQDPQQLAAADGASPSFTLPARGRIVHVFGAFNGDGIANHGISVATQPSAEVVAVSPGRVVFAGPFRGYGQLLILEHPGGYHTLLSGLGRIDTALGRDVQAGEPVGVMGDDPTPVLYVELRHDGQPVDPVPWLMARTKG